MSDVKKEGIYPLGHHHQQQVPHPGNVPLFHQQSHPVSHQTPSNPLLIHQKHQTISSPHILPQQQKPSMPNVVFNQQKPHHQFTQNQILSNPIPQLLNNPQPNFLL